MNYRKREVMETSDDLYVLSKRGGNVFTVRMEDLKEGLEEGGTVAKVAVGEEVDEEVGMLTGGLPGGSENPAEVGDQGLVRAILKNFVVFLEQLFPT